MSGFLQFARTSVLGATSNSSSMHTFLESTPGFGSVQTLLQSWLKLDLATLAAVLTITGTISTTFRTIGDIAIKLYWWITRFFTASISIPANDRLNREILNWLGAKVLERQGTRILTAGTEAVETDAWHYRRFAVERNDYHHEKRMPIKYLPTFGITWFLNDGNVFMVKRVPTSSSIKSSSFYVPDEYAAAPTGSEPLVVMCLGRSVAPIKRFLDQCRDFAEKQREAFVTVRTSKSEYPAEARWDMTILRPIRPLETVHFDEATKTELVADITNYLDKNTRRFYTARGIPYRRGYLLHGPPGTGKTSLSLALAGILGLELYLLHMPSIEDDGHLERLFTALPPRCIVLLEDIDAVGIRRRNGRSADGEDDDDDEDEEKEDRHRGRHKLTLSGLLNVLDGVASQEGRIVLMTSNFADKLDRALVRPGRIDKMIFLGNISPRSAEHMFLRMYAPDTESNATATAAAGGEKPDCDAEHLQKLADSFASSIPDDTFTPAQLQGFLLSYRSAPGRAVAAIGAWVKEEKAKLDEAKQRAERRAERRKARRKEKRLVKAVAQTLNGSDREEQADKIKSQLVIAMKANEDATVKKERSKGGSGADAEGGNEGEGVSEGKEQSNDGISSPEELIMDSEGEKEGKKQ
ncbi:P-loop containing nucleoside triphosphate hydrolase protein [Coniochaeta ligniaria NRRL 30616]|uniref:p-loop containing nucleoside triphosphate hydrolase protein n=1 Tax=Coniochaeta ligniaria NRRL 30616 TaxID=1408157 RepID=A0A1J7JTR1_9PEZI|nr:P-loop containing nucleoside triphosphate hydrolase protein [Coniochaeta ligniaria NRRL 30616]